MPVQNILFAGLMFACVITVMYLIFRDWNDDEWLEGED
jgi:hypothetical protein